MHSLTALPSRLTSLALACAAAMLLAACSKDGPAGATQVAAKVNKEEISVHQINFLLERQPNLKPEQAEAMGRQVLERLIDQQVAIQRAQEQKLDRDPRVLQELEASRRDILARAYINKVTEAAGAPSATEISAYYASKPAVFAERKVYTLQEVQVQADKGQQAALQAQLAKFKSPKELGEYLQAQKLPARSSQNTVPAESLPPVLLDKLASMKDGQTVFAPGPGGAKLITLQQSRPAPVGLEQAKPAIEQVLVRDRKRQLLEQDIKAMRTGAHIEYLGKYAEKPVASASAPGASDAVAPAAGTTVPASPAPTATASADAAASAPGLDANSLDKGLSGLR